ncbi:MAG: MaoC family dehydratase N-terminal domain-containing protein [Chloroflexi bacterium]|nr:MaoC family dehydratase N-terminal domain-containing protein [Chloroflexota bacterium]
MTTQVNVDEFEMKGKITPEGLQLMRNRIGVLIPEPPPFNTEAHIDTIRHFCQGYGDDNPLFIDAAYAKKTRWGGIVAPPMYVTSQGQSVAPKIPDNVRKAGAGALRGVPNYQSGSEWEFVRPVVPGDRIEMKYFIEDVVEKRSEFGGGKAAVVHHRKEYTNQRGELVAIYRYYFFHVEREASEKTGKYMKIEPHVYNDEELAKIDETYEKEFRRGSQTLYWEDVEVGMSTPTMVKGPLTALEIFGWHLGWGWGVFRISPLRLNYLNRKRIPAFYTKNEYGYWEPAQRVHWDDVRAKKVGNPRAYDYGVMRTAWIMHYLTNWIGDDGYIWKESDQARKFNYHGDTQWVKSKVTKKYQDGPRNIVDLEVWCENQRSEIATPGKASVLLPSRTRGPVVIPTGDAKPTPMKTPFAAAAPGCVW